MANAAEKLLNEKCRCCFRMMIDDAVVITEEIRSQFYDLTEIEVKTNACDGIIIQVSYD